MEQQIEKDNREVRLEVILLVILAFSIFLMIANFGKCGKVGDAISGFLFGVIGFAEYIFPVYHRHLLFPIWAIKRSEMK